jgi:aryl-alcohol dehydrogenase-like predicted oxidoreductase
MNTRRLGAQGPAVSALGLGCMGMSAFYGSGDDVESAATIERALELAGVATMCSWRPSSGSRSTPTIRRAA